MECSIFIFCTATRVVLACLVEGISLRKEGGEGVESLVPPPTRAPMFLDGTAGAADGVSGLKDLSPFRRRTQRGKEIP